MNVRAHDDDEGRYRFGPFELDLRARSLLRDGVPVALTNRVFETLLVFVRNPGRVLTKDELLGAVWPGRFMEEGSLKQAIFTLRRALGGDNDDTRYIATASGRGYSFTVPVQQIAFARERQGAIAKPPDKVPFPRWRRALPAGALIGVVVLIGVTFAILRVTTGPGQQVTAIHEPIRPPSRSIGTRSLQVGDTARLILGGTKSSAAFDAFLRGQRAMNGRDEGSYRSALAAFDEAARLDPQYAAAQAKRAFVLMFLSFGETTRDVNHARATLDEALRAANRSIALAPDWGLSHAALGDVLMARLDFARAERELKLARNLAPGDAIINRSYALLEAQLGHAAVAETAVAEAVARHSAEVWGYACQGRVLYFDRKYEASLASFRHAQALSGTLSTGDRTDVAFDYLALGKPDLARAQCAAGATYQEIMCLAIVEQKLGRAAAAGAHFAKLHAMLGDTGAFRYAEIYAQRGDGKSALEWLKKAEGLHDTGLVTLRVDPLLDPVRRTKGFDAIMHHINYPS